MASASLPDFLPPSTGGPTEQMKAYVKLLVQTAQTGVVTDFYNYLQHNPVNEHFDIKARVLEFTTTLETDTRQREQTNNFLFAQYDAKGYGRTGRWIQCAYCKIWYPRHMTLPMIPAADIDNWKTLHHNLCFSCARSSLDNQLLHPGQWLNVQEPPDFQVGEHTQLQAGSPDLTQTANRPAVLRTLDQENNPEHWVPHHWTLALPTTADVTYDAFILHYWSTTQLCWFRTPLANPKSDQYENPQPLTLSQFLSMATKVWKKREYYSRQEFTSRPRLAVYNDVLQQAREQNPTATNSHLRRITANQLAFISNWSTHSVYHMDPKHRDQLLTALTKWHETHAEQALTGESPLKAYIQSPDFTEHLKEWWDAITPSLYNHFLCRNPNCKSVILNSHWLRTMDNNSPKQGVYLCPKCLETYRPFSGISHNKNIGELVPAKQCLVIKVPAQHSANAPVVGGQQLASTDTEHTYHCFLMQWPETDTQYLLNTMKQITADLLEGWIQADDKVLFLHSKLMAHLQKTQLLPYMKREAWTQNNIAEIQNRNTQAGSDKYKLDLLPKTWNARTGSHEYYYDCFTYVCTAETPILEPREVTDLMSLMYTQIFLTEMARPLTQTTKKPRVHWIPEPTSFPVHPNTILYAMGCTFYYEYHYVTKSLACDWVWRT